nr:uncharacterized protein LOC114820686 [Malus domestica]
MTDLKTAVKTAGDLTQMQVQVKLTGTQFGVAPPKVPMPSNLTLANDGFVCPAAAMQDTNKMQNPRGVHGFLLVFSQIYLVHQILLHWRMISPSLLSYLLECLGLKISTTSWMTRRECEVLWFLASSSHFLHSSSSSISFSLLEIEHLFPFLKQFFLLLIDFPHP